MRIGRRRLVVCLAACGAARQACAQPAALERPRSVIALLQNMKRAAGERLLAEETFYREANLKDVFAGTQVAFGRPTEGYRLYGRVSGFGGLSDSVRIGSAVRENMSLDFSLSAGEGAVHLRFLHPTVPFAELEKVFGTGWTPAAYPVPPGGTPAFAERIHGSTAISYALGGAGGADGRAARLVFSFSPRAILETAVAVTRI